MDASINVLKSPMKDADSVTAGVIRYTRIKGFVINDQDFEWSLFPFREHVLFQ